VKHDQSKSYLGEGGGYFMGGKRAKSMQSTFQKTQNVTERFFWRSFLLLTENFYGSIFFSTKNKRKMPNASLYVKLHTSTSI